MLAFFANGIEFVQKYAMGTSWESDVDKFCDKGDIIIIKIFYKGG